MRSLVDCVANKGCQRKSPNIEVPLSKQSLGLEGDSGERHPHASHYPIWPVTSYINQPSNAFAGTRNLILFLISVIRKWPKSSADLTEVYLSSRTITLMLYSSALLQIMLIRRLQGMFTSFGYRPCQGYRSASNPLHDR